MRRKYAVGVARRPTMKYLVLQKVAEAGEVFIDIFFPAKYPEARLWRKILGLDPTYQFTSSKFASFLAKLQSQGLVESFSGKKSKGKKVWRITRDGKEFLQTNRASPLPKPDGKTRLICFDIPEEDRAKRRWLRGELISCGYHQLQKSVWIGKSPLPIDFIKALDSLDLRGRVHILHVESGGTLD